MIDEIIEITPKITHIFEKAERRDINEENIDNPFYFHMELGPAVIQMAALQQPEPNLSRLSIRRDQFHNTLPDFFYSLFLFSPPRIISSEDSMIDYEAMRFSINLESEEVSMLQFMSGSQYMTSNGQKYDPYFTPLKEHAKPYEYNNVISPSHFEKFFSDIPPASMGSGEFVYEVLANMQKAILHGVLFPLIPQDSQPKGIYFDVDTTFREWTQQKHFEEQRAQFMAHLRGETNYTQN